MIRPVMQQHPQLQSLLRTPLVSSTVSCLLGQTGRLIRAYPTHIIKCNYSLMMVRSRMEIGWKDGSRRSRIQEIVVYPTNARRRLMSSTSESQQEQIETEHDLESQEYNTKTTFVHTSESGRSNTGRVVSVSSGVAQISGLLSVRVGERVLFSSGLVGMAMNLGKDIVSVVVFGDDTSVSEGDRVTRSLEMMAVPTGPKLLGRVIDPLGNVIQMDEEDTTPPPEYESEDFAEIDPQPLSILESHSNRRVTIDAGITIVDTLAPIGIGQRKLLIGDRHTGKTSLALDTIINQRHLHDSSSPPNEERVFCIYVAIGQTQSEVARTVRRLKQSGAMAYTTVVVAHASDSPALQYLAAFTGMTLGEYYRDTSQNALVVFDDMNQHADASHRMSLECHSTNDLFTLYSRLFERSCRVSVELGSGTLTTLSILTTTDNAKQFKSNLLAHTLISIMDSYMLLDRELFLRGQRPAVDWYHSTNGPILTKAPILCHPLLRRWSPSLKLTLMQYREIEEFCRQAQELDESTIEILNQGQRLQLMLIQSEGTFRTHLQHNSLIVGGLNYDFQEWPLSRTTELTERILAGTKDTQLSLVEMRNLVFDTRQLWTMVKQATQRTDRE